VLPPGYRMHRWILCSSRLSQDISFKVCTCLGVWKANCSEAAEPKGFKVGNDKARDKGMRSRLPAKVFGSSLLSLSEELASEF
jgi:hypothetical protein